MYILLQHPKCCIYQIRKVPKSGSQSDTYMHKLYVAYLCESNVLTMHDALCGIDSYDMLLICRSMFDINKVSGEKWQALSQEEREAYNRRAEEEVSSSARPVELKQILNQLAKLVGSVICTYMYVHYTYVLCKSLHFSIWLYL